MKKTIRLILAAVFVGIVAGDCMYEGTSRMTNTTWKIDSCTSCHCDSAVVTCSQTRCKDPQCDVSRGHSLVIPANECCPVCSMTLERHCVLDNEVVAHNTEWDGGNCTTCRCDDSAITCSLKRCERIQCGYGEVLRHLSGHCCPKCVSIEDYPDEPIKAKHCVESCSFEEKSYRDGETWNPSECERAYCNKGEVVRHIAKCGNLVCGAGEQTALLEGNCCPTCVGRSCFHEGREYPSGNQFMDGHCRQCICQSGEVTCKNHFCNATRDDVDVGCAQGERRETREGECCSECVSTSDPCDYHGNRYFHGDLWSISKCEVAYCSHGNVRSAFVQCTPVQCKWNEKLVHNSCCPECVPVASSCRHNGFTYRHGDVWKGGMCKRCECLYGEVQCFTADCAVCPDHTVPVSVPGECCPDCQPVKCHSDCVTCDAPGYAHCTSCKRNRLLQGGKCVRRCLPGFYQDGKTCKACHSSCATCVLGESPSTCTSCEAGKMLQDGRCITSCQTGYFSQGNLCVSCPKGCRSCASPTSCSSCHDLTRVPQAGLCVQECGKGYFYNGGMCKACHSSCATCNGSSSVCSTCPFGMLFENGLCVRRCSEGHYRLSIVRCSACHPSCASCTGSLEHQCTACNPGSFLHNRRCLEHCPPAHYARGGQCLACHSGCLSCTGGAVSDCASCKVRSHVIQPTDSSSQQNAGTCQEECDIGHYLDGRICRVCHKSCGTCIDGNSCISCKHSSDVLVVNTQRFGQCVEKSRCVNMGLTADSTLLSCYNATALGYCSSQELSLSSGNCVSSCPSGTFSLTSTSGSICLPCSDHCSTCHSKEKCLVCKEGTYLSQLSSKCVESCEFGFYGFAGVCKTCPVSCGSCAIRTGSTQPVCTSCRDPDGVLQLGQCVTYCIQQFYPDVKGGNAGTPICKECDWSCTTCSGPSSRDCLDCMEDHKLQNGSCVAECSNGYYQSFDRCLQCSDEHCLSCSGSQHCSRCKEDYYLHGSTCTPSCSRGYFSDSAGRVCVRCPPHCLECSDQYTCTQCDAKTFLIDQVDPLGEETNEHTGRRRNTNRRTEACVRQCGRGYYGDKDTRQCEANRQSPVISIDSHLLVGIGSRALVSMITVNDGDTPVGDLLIHLVMEPANGWFELNNTRIAVETSFPYRKVVEGSFWFVHDQTRERLGVATFQATDRHLKSQVATLDVVAFPEFKPIVTKNKLLVIRSGESAKLGPRSCFDIQYEGNMNDITFTLVFPPKYGKIVKLPNYESPIKSFKVSDLRRDVLLYVTHGSITSTSTLHDVVTLQISDGYHVINKVIDVDILTKGNSSAILLAKKGTHVRRGGMTRITNQHLLTIATNVKDKSNIVYVIRPQRKKRGQVIMMVPEMSDAPVQHGIGINEWMRNSQGHYSSPPRIRFSQGDVDNGYIWYQDLATEEDEEEDIESFEFEVYDESLEPAVPLGGDVFQVNLVRENMEPPHLSPGMSSSPHMSANEGMVSVLHSGFLRYTDEDTPDRDILYNITRSLPSGAGILESVDHPHVPITLFTQSDIDSNKIIYRPPVGGIRSVQFATERSSGNDLQRLRYRQLKSPSSPSQSRPELSFQFTVSDGKHTLPPKNFTINLVSSSTAPPVFANQYPILDVSRGDSATIDERQLSVSDHDTPTSELVFTLVKSPRHGSLTRNNQGSQVLLGEGNTFTNADITQKTIRYVHNGDEFSLADQIQISVNDGIHSIVAVIQVSIAESDSPQAPPIADPFTELSLVVEESSEVALTRENLAFVDKESNDEQITYVIELEPVHGTLLKNVGQLAHGSSFTQADINQGRIKYRSRSEIGSLPVNDVMHFQVSDSSGNTLPNQEMQITIIQVRQHPPTVSTGRPVVVGEGREVRITREEMVISDVDTVDRDLIVNVLRKPTHGRIINKRNAESMHSYHYEDVWFTMQDLADGFIFYSHAPDLGGSEDSLTFRVSDGHSTSPVFAMHIEIQTSNARPILRTAPIICRNGHAILIKNISLAVEDDDTPSEDLVFTVTSRLLFGKLVKFKHKLPEDMLNGWQIGGMKGGNSMMKARLVTDLDVGSSFTYQDVLDQTVCYENTVPEEEEEEEEEHVRGSRRRRDTLGLILSDGSSHQNVEMFIDVEPTVAVVKEEPELMYIAPESDYEVFETEELRGSELVLEANTGMTVERGSITRITSNHLRMTGTDRIISYVITRDPNVGQLQYARNNIVANISADGDNEFTQEEIDQGSIRFNHPVSQGGGDVFFMFDVIGGPVDLRFDIHVNEDNIPPKLLTNNGLTVKEGGSKSITTRQLSASDESGRIFYEITQPTKLGRIESSDQPGRSIERFSQDDLVSGIVEYVHTSDTDRTEDQFMFSLSDGTNTVMHTFVIRVLPVDNSLPVLENLGIRVQEGVRKTITEFELKATDRDTSNNLIRFTIVAPSKHGTIDRTTSGTRYVPVTSFSMEDIYESRISYNHDGTNSLTDTFSFKVSDGTNEEFIISEEGSPVTTTEAQYFNIEVVPVDDGTPRLLTNRGLNHLEYMDNKALNVITKRALLTEDPDTEPDRIIYTITSDPRHGHLESTLNERQAIRSFTQADINTGIIRYVLSDLSTDVTRDSFMFNVRDSLPNVVTGNTFNIRWSVITFDSANYTVKEESGSIDIPVLRRGNLNQYAIVLCRTERGSATSSSDGTGPSSGSSDYVEHAGQVQFDEHETEKMCSIEIHDDSVFEGLESFSVELTMPTYALLGNITRTTISIDDQRDIPSLQFMETQYTVEERDTTVFIPIKRTGDVEKPVTVICYTESRSATGSRKGRIESGSDYKTRGRHSGESIVTFAPGVSQMNCDVRIIDDSIYEDSEEFGVRIIDASDGAEIGKFSEATVTITGPNDSPRVFLTDRQFVFAENAGTVDIPVHRSGPDLSRPTDVWCSTKANEPASAIAGQDFIATSTKITFRTDETAKICSLTILDDSQTPTVEGNETFVVYLNSVQKAHLGTPHEAQVIINDTQDDIPKFQFLVSSVDVKENSGVLSLPIQRIGDVSSRASVICYTRQNTATVDDDFTERPRTELSRIVFEEGQRLSLCNVSLTDDGIYESSEKFSVVLGSATGDQWYGASVGSNNHVTVTVTNDEDVPTLEFELEEYSIREPDTVEGTRQLSVKIVRTGDPSEVSRVRCSTRDGSAKSGTDYEPNSRLLRFEPHETSVTFTVNILSNEDTEWQETFLIVLGPQDPVNAVLGTKFQTTVTILDKDAAGSLVLPSTPVVVSLLHYDEVAVGLKSNPSPGYPLVCVTPCDPKYPNYVETQNLCEEAAINASAIRFSWEVAMPTEEEHGLPPFERITDSTPYTSVNTKVLDSIYFGRRFHVRCVAQAVDPVTRNGGTPLRSNVATIATDTGLCHNPIVSGSTRNFQAQSFIANLRYIPETEKQHPNTLHVSVKIPHQDGRLPLISTMPLNNLKLLLSRSIDRQQHVCSNLMYSEERNKSRKSDGTLSTSTEIGTNLGFVEATDYSKLSLGPGYDKPYQFDPNVREAKTIDLYKYLNLKSCIWQFDAYYHMNELIDYCNGKVQRDYQLRDAAESQLTVTVPLHVSYVYVTAPRGWGALEHHTDMQFSFRYKNVFWRTGIQTDGALTGRIQVLRIKIRDDGRLVIEFKTQAKFRGLFVPSHRTLPGRKSRVIPPEGMNIKFELTNLWSESTYDSPYQLWQAVSTYSRKDYSGEYAVEVLPCTVSPTQKWEVTPAGKAVPCTAYSPQEFKIPIMFQQTNRPVPVVYTLQTQFQLCNNEKVFMMDPKNYDQEIGDYDYKGSYTKGQTIFGRVLWTPDQDLKSAYRLQLEKVYLCTGKDGYVPYFDPTGTVYGQGPQYGCIEPSKNLQHRFLLLDRSNRDAEDRYFHDVPFDAYFASDRPDFASMAEIPGVDGFLIKVDGLYKVEAGHQWYIQVLYMIGSEDMVPRVKRSAFFDLSREKIFKRRRRSAYLNDKGDLSDRDILTAGWREGETNNNGTNMRGILIDRPEPTGANVPLIAGIACAVAVAILAFALLLCCCVLGRRRRRKRKEDDLEMVTRKTIALEAGKDSDDDDDVCSSDKKYNHVNTVNISSRKQTNQMEKNHNSNNVRVSNVRSHSSEVPLLTKSYKNEKQNNSRDSSKPLLKHSRRKNLDIQIVNNLKEHTDSGTEV